MCLSSEQALEIVRDVVDRRPERQQQPEPALGIDDVQDAE
jgi:hypothetical protein